MNPVLLAVLAAAGCGPVGLLVPAAIRILPEPPPDPVLAELEARAREGELTTREQLRLAEGPKAAYVDVAAAPGLGVVTGVVSALAAVLVVVAVSRGAGVPSDLVLLVPLVPVGVLLAVVDLRTRMLPRLVVHGGVVLALLLALALWLVTGDPDPLVRAVLGLVVGFLLFYVVWFVYPPGMGFGDVRLAGLCGFLLAHQGWAEWAVGLYSSLLLFSVPGILLAVVRRDLSLLKHHVPFGPFLLLGVLVGLLAGAPLAGRLVTG